MRRREFIALVGSGVAAWPLAARAQQATMPVIGFMHPLTPDTTAEWLRGLRAGLKETGYSEGENVVIEYRWAENQLDRLPVLAGEFVRKPVSVIVAVGGTATALAAKAATTTIPIVFNVGDDPVRTGLVPSLSRPGGNITGSNFFAMELTAKRLEILRELVPTAVRVAMFVNPGQSCGERACGARRAGRRARHGAANPRAQCRQRQGDRCGFRHPCARAARRPACRPRPSLR